MTGLLAARSLNPSFPTVFAKGSASGLLFPLAGVGRVGRVGRGPLGPQQEPSFVLKVLLLWGCSPEDGVGRGAFHTLRMKFPPVRILCSWAGTLARVSFPGG